MAAIFDFNEIGRLGGGKIYTKGAVDGQKIRRGMGVGEWGLRLPEVIIILPHSVRPRTEFLIGSI